LLDIGIKADAAGIGIRHLNPVPEHPVHDRIPLFMYRTGSGIGIPLHSDTGLTVYRIVRHFKKLYDGGNFLRWRAIHPARPYTVAFSVVYT
jgi:hypothetical protein